jgi:hypothetical protein
VEFFLRDGGFNRLQVSGRGGVKAWHFVLRPAWGRSIEGAIREDRGSLDQ